MKVVIVDDTRTNLALMSQLIKRISDVDVTTYEDSATGLAWCLRNEFDLLIVDYTMPGLHGLDFVRLIRENRPDDDVPILMVTANRDMEVRHQALEAGTTDFLIKPVNAAEFIARSRNMLQLRRHSKQLRERATWLADEVSKATREIKEREREAILVLCRASEYRDPETGAHIQRMAYYSRLIAKQLNLPEEEQNLIFEAAPMHDVGKVGIPDQILLKPGRLTSDEMTIMRKHAEIGHRILQDSQARMLQMGAVIAWTHHEKFDGSGYPRGLVGEDIPIVGRIVAVADVFDALTSVRPYKKAWPVDDALLFLKNASGKHFDPVCIDAFFAQHEQVMQILNTFGDELTSGPPMLAL